MVKSIQYILIKCLIQRYYLLKTKSNVMPVLLFLILQLHLILLTVNHNFLLPEWSEHALELFSTYLKNRNYYVNSVEGSVSHSAKVKSVVPQGFILGAV